MTNLDGYDGDQTRQLIEDAHQLTELTRHPGWQILARLAERNIQAWQQKMNSGHLKSLEDYKFCAGWLEGARGVLNVSEDVQRQLERLQAEREAEAEALAALEEEQRAYYPEPIETGVE